MLLPRNQLEPLSAGPLDPTRHRRPCLPKSRILNILSAQIRCKQKVCRDFNWGLEHGRHVVAVGELPPPRTGASRRFGSGAPQKTRLEKNTSWIKSACKKHRPLLFNSDVGIVSGRRIRLLRSRCTHEALQEREARSALVMHQQLFL